jgi:hypothetical protein
MAPFQRKLFIFFVSPDQEEKKRRPCHPTITITITTALKVLQGRFIIWR